MMKKITLSLFSLALVALTNQNSSAEVCRIVAQDAANSLSFTADGSILVTAAGIAGVPVGAIIKSLGGTSDTVFKADPASATAAIIAEASQGPVELIYDYNGTLYSVPVEGTEEDFLNVLGSISQQLATGTNTTTNTNSGTSLSVAE